MAYQGDPVSKGPPGFENTPPTPDDLERLATAFRPSWELDEAPFTGAGSLSPADMQALQGGGTHVDVRTTAKIAGGSFPPSRVVGTMEPVESIVVAEPAVAAPPASPAAIASYTAPAPSHAAPGPSYPAPAPSHAPPAPSYGAPAPSHAPPGPSNAPPAPAPAPVVAQPAAAIVVAPYVPVESSASPASLEALAATRIIPRRAAPVGPPAPAMRPRVESVSSDMVRLARPSRKPLWIGLGVAFLAAGGVGAWLSMSPATDKGLPSSPTVADKPAHTGPDFPPPPPEVKSTATPALTAATPPAPRPYVAPTPAPKPAPRPKSGGSTIVHDVPF